jgi:hypothetical protein
MPLLDVNQEKRKSIMTKEEILINTQTWRKATKEKRKTRGPLWQSEIVFVELSEDDLKAINEYEKKYDKDGNSPKWKILRDTKFLKQEDDRMKYPDGPAKLQEIDFDSGDKSFVDNFFDEFFPSIAGHALLYNGRILE